MQTFNHVLKYRFLTVIRDRGLFFWSLFFPVLLAAVFHFTIGSIQVKPDVRAAVVRNTVFDQEPAYQEVIRALAEDQNSIFHFELLTAAEASDQLDAGEVHAILTPQSGGQWQMTAGGSGFEQTLLQSFATTFSRRHAAITQAITENPSRIQEILGLFGTEDGGGQPAVADYGEVQTNLRVETNPNAVYFFSLFAMASLFGMYLMMNELRVMQANLSHLGARHNLSPVPYRTRVAASLFLVFLLQLACQILLLIFISWIQGIRFSPEQVLWILAVCVSGSLVASGIGALLTAFIRNHSLADGLVAGITMAFSFLGGLMVANLRFVISETVPLLDRLNPVSLISDSLFGLYYFNDSARAAGNVLILLVMSILLLLVASTRLGRRQYASL